MSDRNLANLKLPAPGQAYSQTDEAQTRRLIEQHWHPGATSGGTGGPVTAFATVLLPLDNGSTSIATDQFVTAPITFQYTIVGYRLIEDCGFSGSIELRVDYATADAYPTFTEISGTQRPQLIGSREQQRTTLDGWTATVGEAYSQLRATVIGTPDSLTRVVLAIALTRVDTPATGSVGGGGGSSTDDDTGITGTVWRDGAGAPSDATGNDGDYYLNDTNGDVYTRVLGHYGIVGNIKGSAGATGSAGAAGSVWYNGAGAPAGGLGINGDYYLNSTNDDVYFKSTGVWNVITNIKGATGAAGSATVWHDGAGAPSAGLGSDGDYYLDDTTGNVYLKSAGAWSIVANIGATAGDALWDDSGNSICDDSGMTLFRG